MTINEHYIARLAENSAVPTLLCGRCDSILSRTRIFRNRDDNRYGNECGVIALCSADDCGAVNCCDSALEKVENPERLFAIAS